MTFVSGGLAFWAPTYFAKTLDISIPQSTAAIGVVTFACGLVGTAFGGWLQDYKGAGRSMKSVVVGLQIGIAEAARQFLGILLV